MKWPRTMAVMALAMLAPDLFAASTQHRSSPAFSAADFERAKVQYIRGNAWPTRLPRVAESLFTNKPMVVAPPSAKPGTPPAKDATPKSAAPVTAPVATPAAPPADEPAEKKEKSGD